MKTIATFLLAFSGFLSAAAEKDWTAWQWEAPVEVRETGMARLEVPPALLDVSRPDLGDLRLLSPDGTEMPYLLDLPRHREADMRIAAGFKVTLAGNNTVIEASPVAPSAIDAVELISPAREFLKSVSIEARNENGEWQTLATSEVIFRQAGGAERLRISLPTGAWEALRFTVNDDRSQPIPFTGVRQIIASEKPATSESAVSVTGREELPNETRLTLDLGARNLNVAELRFEIPNAVFSRTCKLEFSTPTTDGGSRMEGLGEGVLYRMVGDDGSTQQLSIPVHRRIPARYLVANFYNRDSQPLTITSAAARCHPTTLLMHAQAGSHRLLAGNRGAPAPEYDLNSLRGAMGTAGARLLTPGPLQAKADFKIPPVLPGVEIPGTEIDLSNWTRRRKVSIGSPGVFEIVLDAGVLAGCQSGLGDLRLIQNGRQIPYLIKLERVTRNLTPLMTPLPPDPKRPTIARWEITLPVDGLPAMELTATSPAPMFTRRFEAVIERKDELGNSWTEIAGATEWTKSQGHDTRLALSLGEGIMPMKFRLQTDHGDNPPIVVENPRVNFSAPVMVAKLTADAPLFLVYGNPKASAPQYDLRLVRRELMAAEPQPASLSEEEILGPDKRGKMAVDAGSPWLWLALAGVVAVLLAVVAKLLPRPATE